MTCNSKNDEISPIDDGEKYEDEKLNEPEQEVLQGPFDIEEWDRQVKLFLYKSAESYYDIGKWLDYGLMHMDKKVYFAEIEPRFGFTSRSQEWKYRQIYYWARTSRKDEHGKFRLPTAEEAQRKMNELNGRTVERGKEQITQDEWLERFMKKLRRMERNLWETITELDGLGLTNEDEFVSFYQNFLQQLLKTALVRWSDSTRKVLEEAQEQH